MFAGFGGILGEGPLYEEESGTRDCMQSFAGRWIYCTK